MGHRHSRPHPAPVFYVYQPAVPPPPPPPTRQEVSQKLANILTPAARDQLLKEFHITSSTDSLEGYTEAIAKASFKNNFSYDWGPSPSPPLHNSAVVQPVAVEGYYVIDSNKNLADVIANEVDYNLKDASPQDWMKRKFTADVTGVITKAFSTYPDNTWSHGFSVQTYNAIKTNADPKDVADSYKFDISFAYTNATLTDSAVEAMLHVLYFVGVYYTVESPNAAVTSELHHTAYSQAKNLSDVTTPVVNSDDTLQQALLQHTVPDFKRTWNFDFPRGDPIDASTTKGALRTANYHVGYLPSKNQTDSFLDNYVEQQIMAGLNIPSTMQSLEASVKNALKSAFQSILATPNSGNWNSDIRIDQTYELQSDAPARFNAKVTYWYGSKTLIIDDAAGKSREETVEVLYLFFLGIVYELGPDPIEQDLRQILYKNIPGTQSKLRDDITLDQLTSGVENYNTLKFRDAYDFAFPTETTEKQKFWKRFLVFDSFNPNDNEIKEKIARELFEPDFSNDAQISRGKQKPVYDFIVDSLDYYSGKNYFKVANDWHSEIRQKNMTYNVPYDNTYTTWALDVRTSWAFSSGKLTEEGRGIETIERFYASLLLDIKAEKLGTDPDDI